MEAINWTGFPTIYYVKAGDKEPVKYDGLFIFLSDFYAAGNGRNSLALSFP